MNKHIIQYTTVDGCIISISRPKSFGATIVSNTYENGVGCITLDAPATKIAHHTFDYCTNLKSIIIPGSVVRIEKESFRCCANLKTVTINNGVNSIGYGAFGSCTCLKNIKFPQSITKINSYAFYYCESLENVDIPNSVSMIGHMAFGGCSKIKCITIPEKAKLDGNPFGNCKSLRMFKGKYASEYGRCLIVDGELKSVASDCGISYTIPNSVTSIGRSAFFGCKDLLYVYIPNSVKYIDDCAFEFCSNLESVNIPSSITHIGFDAFDGCDSIKKVYITDMKKWSEIQFDSVASSPMGNGAILLLDHRLVTDVVIPEGVTSINRMSFCHCLNLRMVTLPNGIQSIDSMAFGWCEFLEDVWIPESITSIGENAFVGCGNLRTVYIMATIPPQGAMRMFENDTELKILVPIDSIDDYKKSKYWSDYADKIIGFCFD